MGGDGQVARLWQGRLTSLAQICYVSRALTIMNCERGRVARVAARRGGSSLRREGE